MHASTSPQSATDRPLHELQAAYAQACLGHAELERARLQQEVQARQVQVAQLSQQLRSASRALHQARTGLKVAEGVLAAERARLEGDFEELLSLPGVHAVELEGLHIRVLTNPIVLEHEARRYLIGDFAIDLDLERGIQVVNLNNPGQKSGWDHPHVQAGQPCLGNLREGFEKLLAEYQLVPLVSMLIQFLESYTPDTAYGSVELWPREDA